MSIARIVAFVWTMVGDGEVISIWGLGTVVGVRVEGETWDEVTGARVCGGSWRDDEWSVWGRGG